MKSKRTLTPGAPVLTKEGPIIGRRANLVIMDDLEKPEAFSAAYQQQFLRDLEDEKAHRLVMRKWRHRSSWSKRRLYS